MKRKVNSVLFIVLVALLTSFLIGFVVIGASQGELGGYLSSLLSSIGHNASAFRNEERATFNLLIGFAVIITLGIMFLFGVQVRRRRGVAFPIMLFLFFVFVVVAFITYKTWKHNLSGIGVVTFIASIIICLLWIAYILAEVSFGFESSEYHFNSKKKQPQVIKTLVVAIVAMVFGIVSLVIFTKGDFGDAIVDTFKAMDVWFIIFAVIAVALEVLVILKKKSCLFPIAFLIALVTLYFIKANDELIKITAVDYVLGSVGNIIVCLVGGIFYLLFITVTLYLADDLLLSSFEIKRARLYNHREKYVYRDRRRFGDNTSVIKEWEKSEFEQNEVENQDINELKELASLVSDDTVAIGKEKKDKPAISLSMFDDDERGSAPVTQQAVAPEVPVVEELPSDAGEDEVDTEEQIEEELETDDDSSKDTQLDTKDLAMKILLLEPEKQIRYNKVRNQLQSYKKIKEKFTKTVDSYRYAGELIAKITVLGKTVRLHLALDPDSYDVEKYHQEDLSSKEKYIFTPFTLKLKSDRSMKYAEELIDELMTGFDIQKNNSYVEEDCIATLAAQVGVSVSDVAALAPAAEEAPAVEKVTAVEETPAVDEAPVAEEAPVAKKPAAKKTTTSTAAKKPAAKKTTTSTTAKKPAAKKTTTSTATKKPAAKKPAEPKAE